jgi:hypothetical protein
VAEKSGAPGTITKLYTEENIPKDGTKIFFEAMIESYNNGDF